MRSKIAALLRPFRRRIMAGRLEKIVQAGLPSVVVPGMRYLIDDTADSETQAVIERVEGIRSRIAAEGERKVDILYSPTPGSSGSATDPNFRPSHGKVLQFTMKQLAHTGKDPRWATFLHLCARNARSEVILELGACVGISGCYLAASPYCKQFITVEGSTKLAEITQNSLSQIGTSAKVINALFDDALDKLLPTLSKIDFAFIDGHHEKEATIHYFERLIPNLSDGAIVLFDDISWSTDMRACWDKVSINNGFSDAIDCGLVGVCIWKEGPRNSPKYWDLQTVLGRQKLGDPHGWKES